MDSLPILFAASSLSGIPWPYLIALVGLFVGCLLGGTVAITAMYFEHQKRRLWHETARTALEKGQPLPPGLPEPASESRPSPHDAPRRDIRVGLIMIAIGAGIYFFLHRVAPEADLLGAIPGFIGVALLLSGVGGALVKRDDPTSRPSQS